MSTPRQIVLVTGLSGAGKASIMGALEDIGFAAIDNPPLTMIPDMVAKTATPLAIGVDCRTYGFDAKEVLATLEKLKSDPTLAPELIYAEAEDDILLRRYTETRRRHPLAPKGAVSDGIAAERALTAALRAEAEFVVDTTGLPLSSLRQLMERRFGQDPSRESHAGMTVTLISFAYPAGLPRQADLVFDARFLRNPHYDPALRPLTGQDKAVGAYIAADPDYAAFYERLWDLLALVLPRFRQEGKKYTSIAIGCTGGKHRSVHLIERLAEDLAAQGWRPHVTHRELAPKGQPETTGYPGLRSAENTMSTKISSLPPVSSGHGIDPAAAKPEESIRP